MEFHSLKTGAQKLQRIGQRTACAAAKKVVFVLDHFNDARKSLRRSSKAGWNEIQRRTKREPAIALLIATGTGAMLGWLIGRDRG